MRALSTIAFTVFALALQAQSLAEKVNTLHVKKFEWLINGNADSLESILADEVSYIHSNGWVQNRQEVLADMQSKKLVYKNIVVEKATVAVHGNTALVTGTGVFAGIMNGTEFSVKLLYTEVYVLSNHRWKLAGRHSCRLL
jgi:hypothetical protein